MDYLLSLRGENYDFNSSVQIIKEDDDYDEIMQNIEKDIFTRY